MIHSIVAKWAFDKAGKDETLSLRCPRCGFKPVESEPETNAPIFCKNCGCEIPSPRVVRRRTEKKKAGK